ncbi:MAG: hypothetical protein RQ826_14025 [Xanthomonadales bacterium]|nr:hypothetical protein [Xanthomonadales bacterium]
MKATNTGNEHAAGAAVDRMASGAHEAVDKIADATNHAADSLSSKGQEIKSLEERWLKKARDYVEHNPVQSLGIALASGYLLSRIISNR